MSGLNTAALWWWSTVGRHDGLRVVDISGAKHLNDDFVNVVVAALDLIRRADPRRYRRVLKHVRFIVNSQIEPMGRFRHWPAGCLVNYNRLRKRPPRAIPFHLAVIIVHEATHGALGVFWPRADFEASLRIERLCWVEHTRFAKRLHPELGAIYGEALSDWPGWQDRYAKRLRNEWFQRLWYASASRVQQFKVGRKQKGHISTFDT